MTNEYSSPQPSNSVSVKEERKMLPLEWIEPLEQSRITKNCPHGLEYLLLLDTLVVAQLVDPTEVQAGYEPLNRYAVLNDISKKIYFALERSTFTARQALINHRGFTLEIKDRNGAIVMQMTRFCRPCAFQCFCALHKSVKHEITVDCKDIQNYVTVVQMANCVDVNLAVLDRNGIRKLVIKGPHSCGFTKAEVFPICNANQTDKIGCIIKQNVTGKVQDSFHGCSDNYSVHFPVDLDVALKVACLATIFLIDYIAFEDKD